MENLINTMTISKINSLLYLGSGKHARHETDEFKKLNINVIINCCNDFTHKPNEKYIIENFPIDDGTYASIDAYLDPVANLINKYISNGNKIYVHCVHGKSRSVSIVIYYLMKYEKITFSEAFTKVKKMRPIISPNLNFIKELKNRDI
jgi:protein-tyrosine phosphatase